MTRFARAKGSKASNERLPNEATPWHVMKQQLEETLLKNKETPEKTKSVKELLAVRQEADTFASEKPQNSWAEFEHNTERKSSSASNKVKKKNKSKLNGNQGNENNDNIKSKKKSVKRNINEVDNPETEVSTKLFKKDESYITTKNVSKEEHQENANNDVEKGKFNKLKKDRKKNKQSIFQAKKEQNNRSNNINKLHSKTNASSKRKKRNIKKKINAAKVHDNSSAKENTAIGQNEAKGHNQGPKRFNNNFTSGTRDFKNVQKKVDARKKQKPPKIRDDLEHKRRKPDSGPLKIMINGMDVEVVKFDGFPVKKEDANRLSDLKQKMIMKGIPKKEIDAAMKLERRKAEKALARIKKCVCFHCRKAGHNLSDCPELGSEQVGTGICFKCGSTEHTHFECKVAKPTEFRYATCFICREQGHIAKQCPDNPKGVYPQGGCCKICGDVTHLKKDCPDLVKEKEENTLTVNTIANGNLESLGETEEPITQNNGRKTKKVVKF